MLSSLYRLLHATFNDWLEHRAASKGAALAFYTLFSLAPVLLLVLAIAGSLYGEAAARGQLFGELRSLLGKDGAQAIELLLAGARNPAAGRWATALANAAYWASEAGGVATAGSPAGRAKFFRKR